MKPKSLFLMISSLLLLGGCGGGGGQSASASTSAVDSASASTAANVGTSNVSANTVVTVPVTGQVLGSPQLEIALSAQQLQGLLSGQNAVGGVPVQAIQQAAGTPVCGVSSYYVPFTTKNDDGTSITVSEAVMMPSGTDPQCSGPRPVILFGHGGRAYGPGSENYNFAQIVDPPSTALQSANFDTTGATAGLVYTAGSNTAIGEAQEVVAMFVAHGYVVVAPNYAGSDTANLTNLVNQHNQQAGARTWPGPSTKTYDVWTNAQAYAQQMTDGLSAARSAFSGNFSSKLFVAGASYGGYTSLAAMKALDAAGTPATAGASIAGIYAPEAISDLAVNGSIANGTGVPFVGLSSSSYCKNQSQPASGCITDSFWATVMTTAGAAGQATAFFQMGPVSLESSTGNTANDQTATSLLNSLVPLSASDPAGKSTENPVLFSASTSQYAVRNTYRYSYLADANQNPDGINSVSLKAQAPSKPQDPVRLATLPNDLRSYVPSMPLLLCDGGQDPTVSFINTLLQSSAMINSGKSVQLAQLDVDPNSATDGTQINPGYPAAVVNNTTAIMNKIVANYLSSVPGSTGQFGLGQYGSVGLSPLLTTAMSTAAGRAQSLYGSLAGTYGTSAYHGYVSFLPCFATTRTLFDQLSQ